MATIRKTTVVKTVDPDYDSDSDDDDSSALITTANGTVIKADVDVALVRAGPSSVIIVIGIVVIFVTFLVVGIYVAYTAAQDRQRVKTGAVVVNNQGSAVASQAFTNVYIRSNSGYWFDSLSGIVTFTILPQQKWSFDGRFLVNQITHNALYSSNGVIMLGMLPDMTTPRTNYQWAWNAVGAPGCLQLGYTAGQNPLNVVTDRGLNPSEGFLQLVTATQGSIPQGAQLTLVSGLSS